MIGMGRTAKSTSVAMLTLLLKIPMLVKVVLLKHLASPVARNAKFQFAEGRIRIGIPLPVLKATARVNDLAARILNRDLPLAYAGIRMAELMSPLDHSKAERELGWKPGPVEESIREAAQFFVDRRRSQA